MATCSKTVTINSAPPAEGTFTDAHRIKPGGVVTVETSNLVATITLEVMPEDGSNWVFVDSYSVNGEEFRAEFNGYDDDHRIGVKQGDYSSGSGIIYLKGC